MLDHMGYVLCLEGTGGFYQGVTDVPPPRVVGHSECMEVKGLQRWVLRHGGGECGGRSSAETVNQEGGMLALASSDRQCRMLAQGTSTRLSTLTTER